jgi:hypothetical protein
LVTGDSELGGFACELSPTDHAALGDPSLVGALQGAGRTVAFATVGPTGCMTELAKIKSATGQWTLSLSVLRQHLTVSEGDIQVVDSEFGEIVQLQRRNFSWSEQIQSGFGLRRSRRGAFLDIAEQSLTCGDKKLALLFLLVCYFQLLELPFNTDTTSS